MSTSPSSPSRRVAVTVPVNVSIDPGNTGTPSRMARRRTIASGPAQSVRKRLQYALLDKMFMKMSGAPCAFAYSRSWWTGMKSRVASAPATITVAVASTARGVSSSPGCTSRQRTVVSVRVIPPHPRA